ncbi:hypothetical protein Tco_0548158 [Tanacetum coccineum]
MINTLTTMAVLESCPKHNMVAYLEKTEVQSSSLPTFVEQFLDVAKSKMINNTQESSDRNQGGHLSSDKSLSGNEGDMTLQSVYDLCISLCTQTPQSMMKSVSLKQRLAGKRSLKKTWVQKESVSKQGRKFAKGEPSVHKDSLFDEIPKDTVDYMETEVAQDVGTVKSTDKEKDSTERTDEGTDDQTEGRRATQTIQTTQTPTSTMFGDDETIAQVLLNMSQAKAVSREKEKGVEFKDVEETERPRPTSTRSLLTLKPLPKIDPKDKGKKKIKEEDESETESEEEEGKRLAEEEATNDALIRNYDDIKARIEADRLLAERLQEQEREQFTVEERAKFLHDTIAAQRRFLAQQRSEAIRNKPPTKNQLRN